MIRTFVHPASRQRQELAVGDLLAGECEWLVHDDEPTVVYSDPPWNPGNEKWWRRHAGAAPPASYDDLLDAWCSVVARLRPFHVFCEQSVNPRHRAMFMAAIERCPHWTMPLLEEWTVYYGSPGSRSCVRPNVLLHFGHPPRRQPVRRRSGWLPADPSGLRGEAMTRRVFEGLAELCFPWRGESHNVLVDPCTGKGMTSRMAHEFGWPVFRGTELNPKRLDYAIAWLLKRGYAEVLGVGQLTDAGRQHMEADSAG